MYMAPRTASSPSDLDAVRTSGPASLPVEMTCPSADGTPGAASRRRRALSGCWDRSGASNPTHLRGSRGAGPGACRAAPSKTLPAGAGARWSDRSHARAGPASDAHRHHCVPNRPAQADDQRAGLPDPCPASNRPSLVEICAPGASIRVGDVREPISMASCAAVVDLELFLWPPSCSRRCSGAMLASVPDSRLNAHAAGTSLLSAGWRQRCDWQRRRPDPG